VFRGRDGRVWRDLTRGELRDAVARADAGEGELWVDVDSTDAEERRVLPEVFGFHPLAIEDALNPNSRVKVEEYADHRPPDGPGVPSANGAPAATGANGAPATNGAPAPAPGAPRGPHLLVVLRAVRLCEETPDDPYDTETTNLTLFVERHVLVTVHAEPAPSVDAVVDLVQRNPDLMARGAGRLAHMVCDNAIDAYFPVLDQLDGFVAHLEERVLASGDAGTLQEIIRAKRLVLTLRRYLMPQREAFNVLSNRPSRVLPPAVQTYFRDVYDHVLRINDTLDTYRELLGSTQDAYLTQVNNRLGQVTTGLSVVATLSIPFVVVSGMWGMNFERVPLSHHPHGFVIMLVLQLVLGVALVALLRWRRLL
jgi:magnesium transporter